MQSLEMKWCLVDDELITQREIYYGVVVMNYRLWSVVVFNLDSSINLFVFLYTRSRIRASSLER